jgi:MSHA biogenesis protein MshK
MAQRLIALSILLAASSPSPAQVLNDPTKPPASTSLSPEEAAPGEAAVAPSRLQSVLISPSRRTAVIDGRAVTIGDRVGDATLVAIAPSEVILQRGAERQALKLHPGVEKTTPVPTRLERKVKP